MGKLTKIRYFNNSNNWLLFKFHLKAMKILELEAIFLILKKKITNFHLLEKMTLI